MGGMPAPAGQMAIFVKTLTNKTITINVPDQNMSVDDIKAEIERREGFGFLANSVGRWLILSLTVSPLISNV